MQWYSNNDYITPSMIAFATELYVPKFCYDYAYKQEGKYFTEDNDGSQDPRIVGDLTLGEDINVTIFVRNLVDSDIDVTDFYLDIIDINTTEATYIRQTTSIAQIPNIIPTPIDDGDIVVSDSYIKDIDIGTMSSNDYFYIYYSLDPKNDDIDMAINVQARYNLTLSGITIPYILDLGGDIDLCSSTNFAYTPVPGAFTVAHQSYYNSSNTFYNLPTQITSREGNFKVLAFDDTDTSTLDTLKDFPNKTSVAVELIDISAFHDTFTSCKELESAISPRIWVDFDANTSSTAFNQAVLMAASARENLIESEGGPTSVLPNSYDFYKVANENTAFRISYITDLNNTGLLQYTEDNVSGVKILNFVEVVQTVGKCSQKVYWDKATGNGTFCEHLPTV